MRETTFKGKHALVTGGAKGIGRCIAEHFLNSGASVTIIDIDKQAGQTLIKRHENLYFFHGDIAKQAVLEQFVSELNTPVDVLVNNAYITQAGILSACSYAEFEAVQRVCVTAPYYLTSLLLQNDLLIKGASIVNIASTRSKQSQPDTESYSAAKGAIVSLSHALAVSLAGHARVNCISPGWIETADYHEDVVKQEHTAEDKAQHLVGRVGRCEDIANMVLYLCKEEAGFINGETITIDGGMSRQMIYHGDNGWKLKQA